MPQKTGNGGHGQENYDEKTGRYVASSGFSKDELKDFIENGKLDMSDPETQEIVETYNSFQSEEEKEDFLDALNEFLAEKHTQELHQQEFTELNGIPEYLQFHKDQENSIPAKVTINGNTYTREELIAAAEDDYFGMGWVSFEEQKAKRYYEKYGNFDEFREYLKNKYGDDMSGPTYYDKKRGITRENLLSDNRLLKWFDRMDYITSHGTAPKDMRVGRYLETNWFVSSFKQYLPSTMQLQPDGYGYEELAEPDVNKLVDSMYEVVQGIIGNKIPADGSFVSCSCVPSQTHVGHNDGPHPETGKETYRPILMNIDVPKGHGIYIGDYPGESEACLPQGTAFFVKGVTIDRNVETYSGKIKPRLIITVGIQEGT